MIKIMKFKYISVLLSLFLVSLLVTCKEEKGVKFGKEWINDPDEELLEENIYYVRNYKNTNSEELFKEYNVDPKEVAKLVVVKYAKDLVKIFEQKDYEDFVWQISRDITDPMASKLNLKNEKGAIQNILIKGIKNGKAYCSVDRFFNDPIKKIEIRAYRAYEPSKRENGNTDYFFIYRIDFIQDQQTKEGTEIPLKGNAITINVHTNFVKEPTILITRIIDHCPVPELIDKSDAISPF